MNTFKEKLGELREKLFGPIPIKKLENIDKAPKKFLDKCASNSEEKKSEADNNEIFVEKEYNEPSSFSPRSQNDEGDLTQEEFKTNEDFINYAANNRKLVQSVVEYYKKLLAIKEKTIEILSEKNLILKKQIAALKEEVDLSDELSGKQIELCEEENSVLEKQVGFCESIITDFESSIEDSVLGYFLKNIEPKSLQEMLYDLWPKDKIIENICSSRHRIG